MANADRHTYAVRLAPRCSVSWQRGDEYFHWKKHFKVVDKIDNSLKNSMCQLCAALNAENPRKKIYDDIDHWWRDLGHCKVKGFFRYDQSHGITVITLLILFVIISSLSVIKCWKK